MSKRDAFASDAYIPLERNVVLGLCVTKLQRIEQLRGDKHHEKILEMTTYRKFNWWGTSFIAHRSLAEADEAYSAPEDWSTGTGEYWGPSERDRINDRFERARRRAEQLIDAARPLAEGQRVFVSSDALAWLNREGEA